MCRSFSTSLTGSLSAPTTKRNHLRLKHRPVEVKRKVPRTPAGKVADMRRYTGFIMLFMLLAGCKVGPDYRRPAVDTPNSWRFEEKEAQDLINTVWWEQFNDPV